MKRAMAVLLCLFMILSLAACNTKNDNPAETNESIEQIPQTEMITQSEYTELPVATYSATKANDFEKYGLEYDLNEKDISIVRNFYTQIAENYMSIQNSNTEQYTRNPIDIWKITMIYFGDKPIIGCHYMYVASEQYNDTYEFALAFEMDDQGNLSETDFDVIQYVSENTGKFGMTEGNIVITYVQIGTPTIGRTFPHEEKEKIKYTIAMYSNYKKLRQEKYGDINDSADTYHDKLDENQRTKESSLIIFWKQKANGVITLTAGSLRNIHAYLSVFGVLAMALPRYCVLMVQLTLMTYPQDKQHTEDQTTDIVLVQKVLLN